MCITSRWSRDKQDSTHLSCHTNVAPLTLQPDFDLASVIGLVQFVSRVEALERIIVGGAELHLVRQVALHPHQCFMDKKEKLHSGQVSYCPERSGNWLPKLKRLSSHDEPPSSSLKGPSNRTHSVNLQIDPHPRFSGTWLKARFQQRTTHHQNKDSSDPALVVSTGFTRLLWARHRDPPTRPDTPVNPIVSGLSQPADSQVVVPPLPFGWSHPFLCSAASSSRAVRPSPPSFWLVLPSSASFGWRCRSSSLLSLST